MLFFSPLKWTCVISQEIRCDREWLYWYDEQGNRYPTIEEIAARERQRAERLAEQLKAMGINPEEF
jgi:hypothetical protein